MARMTFTGSSTLVTSGYIAEGESDQSEGRGGRRELGRFTTVGEAVQAVQGEGVQGSPGYVSKFAVHLFEGGLLQETRTTLYGRPAMKFANHDYTVGWLNPDGSRWEGPEGTHPS